MKFNFFRAAVSASLILLFCLSAVISAAANQSKGSITMTRSAIELYIGETDTLSVKGSNDGIEWSSSDDTVVKVDQDGNVTGISVGQASVTASADGQSVSATVYVVEKEYSFDDNIMISIFWPPTQGYITEEQYQYMEDAGITWIMGSGDNLGDKKVQLQMLELAYKHGIHMTVGDGRLGGNLPSMRDSRIKSVVNEYRNVPAANGYYMLDEPYNPNDFISAYKSLKEADPNSYMHLNFLPYAAYPSVNVYMSQMNDWLKLCAETGYPQDYLMYDLYPYGTAAGSMNREGFLTNLEAVRLVGLENNVKTATYIQSVCIPGAYRSPNRAETLYEINMALAFGVKQLSYFTWFTPHDRSEPFEDGIITSDGKPNPKFKFICELDKKVLTIGKTLINCDALEVYGSKAGSGAVKKVSKTFMVYPENNRSDFTVSYLRDRNTGRNYCMVVNNDFTKSQTIALKFADDIGSLQYLSYEDGQLYPVEMDNGTVTLEYEAGGAYIFALPEGYDRGKNEPVPEAGENLAKYGQISCTSSSGAGGWYMNYLNDGNRFSSGSQMGWQSRDDDGLAAVTVDLGAERQFNRIDIYPAGSADNYGENFPAAFTVSTSADGKTWEKTAEAENFSIINKTVPSLKFGNTEARYIKIEITASGNKKSELCEIEVYLDDGTVPETDRIDVAQAPAERGASSIKYKSGSNIAKGKTVKVSSYPQSDSYRVWGWYPDFLVDENAEKGWTSDVKIHMSDPDSTEYAVIDLGDFFNIEQIDVIPLGCWPEDFNISVSDNGTEWTQIASETESQKAEYDLKLENPVKGRYVRFMATKLRNTSADGYMLQLGDIKVYGEPYKDTAEAQEMIDAYVSAGGAADSKSCEEVKKLMNDETATQSQLDKAMKTMLDEYGLKLKPYEETKPGENVKYTYKYLRQTESVPAGTDTETDTVTEPVTDPASDTPAESENTVKPKKKASAAAIIASVCAGAVIIGSVIALIRIGKKK